MSPSTSPSSWNICSPQPFPSFLWISLINTIPANTSSSLSPYVHLCPLKSVPITSLTLWGHYHFIQLTPDFFFRHPTCGACALTASNIISQISSLISRIKLMILSNTLFTPQLYSISLPIDTMMEQCECSRSWPGLLHTQYKVSTIPLTTMSASSLALPDQLLLFSNIWFELPF